MQISRLLSNCNNVDHWKFFELRINLTTRNNGVPLNQNDITRSFLSVRSCYQCVEQVTCINRGCTIDQFIEKFIGWVFCNSSSGEVQYRLAIEMYSRHIAIVYLYSVFLRGERLAPYIACPYAVVSLQEVEVSLTFTYFLTSQEAVVPSLAIYWFFPQENVLFVMHST